MYENTINADVTMGGSEGSLLANRYRVVRPLGQGGMGSVWLAADTQLDNREVAIKMLPSILVSNKRAYNQLKSEALVSLKLTHPNIAAVRAFEENGGNPFLVVDYIDGQTLDDYLADKGKLSEDETIRLLGPIASALDYAHGEGVVHRDVKPGNVMIRKDGHPFILDFGIAREIQETMTRVTGKLSSGTLMYMSPEQLHGAAPKSSQDVYSFAAMAYECLMGAPPFSRGQIECQIEHDSPAPCPHFMKCGQGVMSGLAKNPAERPSSCSAVLAHGGADSMNPPQIRRGTRFLAVLQRPFSIGAVMLSLVALVVAFYVRLGKDVSSERDKESAMTIEEANAEIDKRNSWQETVDRANAQLEAKKKSPPALQFEDGEGNLYNVPANETREFLEEVRKEGKVVRRVAEGVEKVDATQAVVGRASAEQKTDSSSYTERQKQNVTSLSDKELLQPDVNEQTGMTIEEANAKEAAAQAEADRMALEKKVEREKQEVAIVDEAYGQVLLQLKQKFDWVGAKKTIRGLKRSVKCSLAVDRIEDCLRQLDCISLAFRYLRDNVDGMKFSSPYEGVGANADQNGFQICKSKGKATIAHQYQWGAVFAEDRALSYALYSGLLAVGSDKVRVGSGEWSKIMLGYALVVKHFEIEGATKAQYIRSVIDLLTKKCPSVQKTVASWFGDVVKDDPQQNSPVDPDCAYANEVVKNFNFSIASHFVIQPSLRMDIKSMFVTDDFWKSAAVAKKNDDVLGVLNALSGDRFDKIPPRATVDNIFERLKNRPLHIALTFVCRADRVSCFRVDDGCVCDGMLDIVDNSRYEEIDERQVVLIATIGDSPSYLTSDRHKYRLSGLFYGTGGYNSTFRSLKKKVENNLITREMFDAQIRELNCQLRLAVDKKVREG